MYSYESIKPSTRNKLRCSYLWIFVFLALFFTVYQYRLQDFEFSQDGQMIHVSKKIVDVENVNKQNVIISPENEISPTAIQMKLKSNSTNSAAVKSNELYETDSKFNRADSVPTWKDGRLQASQFDISASNVSNSSSTEILFLGAPTGGLDSKNISNYSGMSGNLSLKLNQSNTPLPKAQNAINIGLNTSTSERENKTTTGVNETNLNQVTSNQTITNGISNGTIAAAATIALSHEKATIGNDTKENSAQISESHLNHSHLSTFGTHLNKSQINYLPNFNTQSKANKSNSMQSSSTKLNENPQSLSLIAGHPSNQTVNQQQPTSSKFTQNSINSSTPEFQSGKSPSERFNTTQLQQPLVVLQPLNSTSGTV